MVSEVGSVMGKSPFVHLRIFLSSSRPPTIVSTSGPYYHMSLFIVGL